MSYAKVAASGAPPASQQPHADPALLFTESSSIEVVDDSSKINIAPPDFKKNPHTTTSESNVVPQYASDDKKSRKQKAKHQLEKAEQEGEYLWEKLREQLLRPGVAGGLIGLVNVGLLASAGYQLYTRPALRSDARVVGGTVVGALLLLGVEGLGTEAYAKTDAGREEAHRAKEEGAALYRHTKEIVLRPSVLGGVAGVVNVGILGTVAYFAYQHWDMPRWDRKTIGAISAGLITLYAGEGYLAEQYKENEYPKKK